MKLEGFAYDVSARVTLKRAEIDALVKISGYHHDAECVAAGLYAGQQHPHAGAAERNGFLAAASILCENGDGDAVNVVWPFRNFGIALNILEQRSAVRTTVKDRILLDALTAWLHKVCGAIQKEHERLTKGR